MRGIWATRWAIRWAVVLASNACGFSPHAAGDSGVRDAALGGEGTPLIADAFADAPPGEVCFGMFAYDRICYLAANVPAGPKRFQVVLDVNTDDPVTCTGNTNLSNTIPGNPCIIAAGDIDVSASGELDIFGSRPLILLATGPEGIDVEAGTVVDASSNDIGAGPAAPGQCDGSTDATQKSGGFGGTFLALGGKGGLGSGDGLMASGRPATALGMPAALHGGCPGGVGGSNIQLPAPGGGAVALVAMTLTIDGLVAAGGAGGLTSSDDQTGGNGGGAGGMIVLDAPAIAGAGELDAKGGGGGEGKGGNLTSSGNPGYNPVDRAEDGLGGATAGSSGGDGGHGGPYIDPTSMPTNSGGDGRTGTSAGGGGGGGAAGLVIATSALPRSLRSSPTP